MRGSRFPGVLVLFLLGLIAADRATASVVTSMDTETLVRLSAVIVRGTVESQAAALDPQGNVQTWITLHVEENLKGAAGRARVTLAVPGGIWGDRVSLVYGAARFTNGEPVVVFAAPTRGGVLTVTGLFQGKFRIESKAGVALAVPEPGDTVAVLGRVSRSRQPLDRFLSDVRALVDRYPASSSLVVPEQAPPEGGITPAFTFVNPILPLRWFEPDMGLPISYRFNVAFAPLSATDARAGFAATLDNWSHLRGVNVTLTNGGDTSLACRIFNDGSVISHGDPCAQMEPFDPVSCSGILAVTGVSGFTLETKVVNGVSFLRMTESDTVFNADTECFFDGSEKNYEEVLSHELGHGIGLGHSCGDIFSPECVEGTEADDALMRAFAHGEERGGMPRADDIDGARLIYPTAGFVDLLQNRDTFTTGQTLMLRADFNGTMSADVYVIGIRPDRSFFSLAPGLPSNQLVPLATNVGLAFTRDVPLFNHAFTGAEPAGTYSWIAVLARPGTDVRSMSNWLSFDTQGFTFTP